MGIEIVNFFVMADNYLEKKFEEFKSGSSSKKHIVKNQNKSLNDLLLKNRSYRGYDSNYIVTKEELMEIVGVNNKLPSARNQQVLRFRLVTCEEADKVFPYTKWAGALAELHLPFEGTEPNAFIVVCSTAAENKWVDIDLGISAQSMLLKAVDMGLNGICIGSYNKEEISKNLGLAIDPIMVIAIGKGIEKIQLTSISEGDNHNYYRKEGLHFVPKVNIGDLIL